MISKQAILQIDFLIVGGGIAGLACAFALGRSGHRIRVLEKNNGLHQRSGGIRVPPNLTKILLEWGLQDELASARRCRKSGFHSLETGELVGYLEWKDDVIEETGGEFLLMHYGDLYNMLYKLALSTGAIVSFNTTITSVSVDGVGMIPSVTLADGTILSADVVVGADGARSSVRDFVNGMPDDGVGSGYSLYTITAPADNFKNGPDREAWDRMPDWPIWMGNLRNVVGYSVRNGEEYCLHVDWPDKDLQVKGDSEEGWDVVVPTDTINFDGLDPLVKRLFHSVPDALRTRYVMRDRVEEWVDEVGRIVLVGEAAHPLRPCGMHGASLAVEDAAVLGTLMSRLQSVEQIPQLLDAFQDLRQNRCDRVHTSEVNNVVLVGLPPGETREMRDAGLRVSLEEREGYWDDEGHMREQWDEVGDVFGYNAREAAEDWWVKWGALGNSTKVTSLHEPFDVVYEISQIAISA